MAAPSQSSHISRRQLLTASTAALSTAPLITREPVFARQTPVASPEASPVAVGPQLYVSATEVQFDEAFDIGVTGLESLQEIEISSSYVDAMGKEWTAEGTFVTDLDGNLWLAEQAPVEGTFDVADPMALIWSAAPRTAAYYAPTVYGAEQVVITARVDDAEIGTASVSRTILPEGGAPVLIEGPDLVAEFYEPAPGSQTPAPAVVVLGGSEGGIFTQLVAGLLASHGYATLAVGYFNIGVLPDSLVRIPLEYFAAAFDWLDEQPNVDARRLGVVGFSRGGELALLLGAYYPEITAVVSYNRSGLVIVAPWITPYTPAWTWQENDLPFAMTYDDEAAEIPVEHTNGPVLLISGDADQLWDSSPLSRIAWNRLQRTKHPWPDQFLHYSGAGHGINVPYAPKTEERVVAGFPFGGDQHSDQIASVNSWRAVLTMLEWRLKQGS